ncbi:MAG: hypothetical protein JO024_01520 [Candidatus Eremiobacteraeota bacterium]|nr:hypothetical protein [Candidatus Eremiobacteraeota bacterium]
MKFRSFDSRASLVQRPWTAEERHVVWRGMMGRLSIAAEPLLGTIVFSFLTWGIIWRAHHNSNDSTIIVIAPVFAIGAAAFTLYAIALMVAPIRAFLQTFKPIYVVDGYVRYRGPDDFSEIDSTGYVAVLFEDESVACEWEAFGQKQLPNRTIPTLAEFSQYGGIHKIDGRPTGVLPLDGTALNVGLAPRRAKIE